jgi:SCY1-like protein 2
MKDTHLLPYILPNVFSIATALSPSQFASTVLPSLKPLFSIKEPPQNMLTLLDNLGMLQSKTDQGTFRERKSSFCALHSQFSDAWLLDVLPLVYNALESDHAVVSYLSALSLPQGSSTTWF